MIIDIVTIFPAFFADFKDYGVIREAFSKEIIRLNAHDLRDFSKDRHRKVDDKPYGGGFGMVMSVQPFFDAVKHIKKTNESTVDKKEQKVILFTPRGQKLNQNLVKELSQLQNIIMLCGRYEGIDERVSELVADQEISIGDYILTGGELPAMILIDAIARLLPGVIHSTRSLEIESFEKNLLEYPQYTRPPDFKGKKVPEILLNGNHSEIEKWRKKRSEEITRQRRPDLFDKSF